MALVPATINLNWISNYNGPHRVCFRIVGAPTYTCTVPGTPGPGFHPLCGGGGAPCSYAINILVDNETCDQVDYEGYIQAACEDELSVIGRDPFAISFIPDPACNRYNVTCGAVGIASIAVVTPGAGYTNGSVTALPITGGGGTLATADGRIGDGEVISFVEDNLGTGFTPGVYGNVSMVNVGGVGVGLEMNITVDGGGLLTVDSIAAPGTGYVDGDIVNPGAVVGVPGVQEAITVQVDNAGELVEVIVTAPGSGYTSVPTVDTSPLPGGGAGATALAALAPCGALTVYECNGVSGVIIPGGTFNIGDSTQMCGSALPTIPSDYSVVEDGNCLCNCESTNVGNSGPDGLVTYYYIDCNGNAQTGTLGTLVYLGATCMVAGSLETTVTLNAVADITVGVPCDGV